MPRQDVPYDGAICRLKERIAEIWDKLGEKLHSINGVEGDAAGDVKIVSADPAVVITNNAASHEIEIGLDSLELPSAAVSSVNGQTGAVVLDANDIDAGLTPPGTSVAQDLAGTKQQMQTVGGLLQQEIIDRQNADSTLQGNINTMQASIPGAAATAVANDPTVAQLVTDLAGKVDLSDVSTVETPNTIAKRNGSGRLVAADPASGATDKTLVTANWISQTGETRPNNLIHATGSDRFRSYFQQTGFSNSAGSSQGVNLQVVRPSDDLSATIGAIAITRNIAGGNEVTRQYMFSLYKDSQNWIRLSLEWVNATNQGRLVLYKAVNGVTSATTVATL